MRFWNSLLNSFTKKPRNATEFIEKFIRDSKKCRVQLEILRDYEILIQTDALRFTPSWFKVFNINENEFKNGFVIFFIDKSPIRTFAKFIKETNDPVFLGKEMKKIIDGIFDSSESDPQALFNLRYIEEK